MLVNRDPAAIVGDGQAVAFFQRDLDPVGMTGDGFVHRIVEHFRREVVQGALVRAANVHAGAAADGLKPLQHLDRRTIIGIAAALGQLLKQVIGHGNAYRTQRFR